MHMKLIIFLVALGVVAGSSSIDWFKYKRDFNKQYESIAEENKRREIFIENVNRIRAHQQMHPSATFTIGINHLTDRRIDELVSNSKRYVDLDSENIENIKTSIKAPDSLDWRTKGVITPVKDQGTMGQADAVASVEVIETLHAIKTGQLESGSIARVADCCPQPVDPFQCISKLGGICSAAEYPSPTGQCIPNRCKPFATFDHVMRLKNQNENTMVTWIQNSTLYVGIDASRVSFQMYIGGIYNDPSCSKTAIDHLMQLVGYGKTDTGDIYWICKNSWGASWGEQGYIRILRGQNTCGIASYVAQVA